jgi:hypothetical protein
VTVIKWAKIPTTLTRAAGAEVKKANIAVPATTAGVQY